MFKKGYTPWNKGKNYRYKPLLRKNCIICGKEFIKRAHEGFARWNSRKYCDIKCCNSDPNKKSYRFTKGHIPWIKGKEMPKGENCQNWKGGRYQQSNGYWLVYSPEHPNAIKGAYILEHRLVAEKCLGRYLDSKEVIHHINEDQTDNRPENLYLFPYKGAHYSFHNLKNKPVLTSNLIT
jgi:hypothetical protein